MSEPEVRVDGQLIEPPAGWTFSWLDEAQRIARLSRGDQHVTLLVEGDRVNWAVTIRGRRLPVTVSTWRERMLAEAEVVSRAHAGPLDITATLPGLIAAVEVEEGGEVVEGQALLTIEAMKMQNEVRAPRGGRVVAIAARPGQTVAKGALLLRLE